MGQTTSLSKPDDTEYTNIINPIIPRFVSECCQQEYGAHVNGEELLAAINTFADSAHVPSPSTYLDILQEICKTCEHETNVKCMVITCTSGKHIVINMRLVEQ